MARIHKRRRRIRYLSKARVIALWLGLSVLAWPVVYLVAYAITALGAETAATVVALALGGLIFASIAILNDLNINVFSLTKELFQAASRDMSRLEYAASRGDRKRVTELLLKENQNRFNALTGSDIATLRLLLDSGIDVNVRSRDGQTALMCERSEEGVQILLDAGADVNAIDSTGLTALHFSVSARKATTEKLLKSGANVHAVNDDGKTALHWAVSNFWTADTTKQRDRLKTIIEQLVYAGCNPSWKDTDGDTALHKLLNKDPSDWGREEEFVPGELKEVAMVLLKSMTDVNSCNTDGENPLHLASKFAEYAECLPIILANGGSVNSENNYQQTPLHLASEQENSLAIEALLQSEVNPNTLDVHGNTPLHYAVDASVATRKVARKSAKKATRKIGIVYERRLSYSARLMHINMLLSAGADPNAMKTESPLHRACLQYELDADLIDALISAGSDVRLLNNRGQSSLDLLRHHRDRDTASVLLERYDQKKAG